MKLYSDAALAKILDQEIFHYVRDIFLERPSDDIDVVVVGSGISVAKELKKELGRKAHLSVFKNFGTAQVKINNSQEIEFVGARKESYQHDSRKPIVEDGTLDANPSWKTGRWKMTRTVATLPSMQWLSA